MAEKVTIGGSNRLYLGEDKTLQFFIRKKTGGTLSTVLEDITSWSIRFMVKTTVKKADIDALINKTASIEGTYDATPGSVAQWAQIVLTDTETEVLKAKTSHHYQYSLKRENADGETILAEGDFILQHPAQVS